MAGALIGALRVSLSAETSAFEAGMKKSQQTANRTAGYIRSRFGSIGTSIKAGLGSLVAAVTIGTVVAAGKAALDYASHLKELAETLGLTSRDLQTFSYAAGQVGISQEELEAGIQKLTISMGKAQVGSQAQVKAFNAIGISVDQLKGKNAGEVFRLIADRLEKIPDRAKRAAVEVALFGKSGAKLDNLLSGAEGRLEDLTRAAEDLGIVLSEEQIQKADKTADKIAELQTVLKARVAGVVADNASAIYDLASALAELVVVLAKAAAWLGRTGRALDDFAKNHQFAFQLLQFLIPGGPGLGVIASAVGGGSGNARQISVKLPKPTHPGAGGGGVVTNFLAPGGAKARKGRADHSAEEAERKAFQFQQDLLRAQEDILQARKDLAGDYVEETQLEVAILDLQRQQYKAELDRQVRTKDITQAQAEQLLAQYDIADGLKREKILQDEETKRAEEYAALDKADFERKQDVLARQADLAETQAERRQIELDILDLAYQEKKQALEHILQTSKDFVEIENARRDLADLKTNFALDRQGVLQNTRGPMDEYLASLPTTAAKADEALQRLEVQGFQGLIDAAGQLSEGFDSAAQALLQTLKSFIAGLLQMQLQKGLGSFLQGGGGSGFLGALGSIFGGGGGASLGWLSGAGDTASALSIVDLPAFASGGSGMFKGRTGIDRNILSMNGLPIARVSYGERFSFGNDNSAPPMHQPFIFNNYARMSGDEARRTGAQAAAGWAAEINRSRRKGIS